MTNDACSEHSTEVVPPLREQQWRTGAEPVSAALQKSLGEALARRAAPARVLA